MESFISEEISYQTETIYLIGNGFDIGLGLKTKYSDFAKSEFWPFGSSNCGLGFFLNRKKEEVKTWLDLEYLLGKYAQFASNPYSEKIFKNDVSDFELLCSSFSRYIAEQQNNYCLDVSCPPAKLILKMDTSRSSLYSFNFTNFKKLFHTKTGIDKLECHNVHGVCENNSIVLGFGDNISDINPSYNIMRKSINKNYNPPPIIRALIEARTIVYYGLSMGDIDYSYFDYFFYNASNPESSLKVPRKRIYIFTYDDASRLSILNNLYIKTNGHLSNLRVLNEVHFFTVKDAKEMELMKIINDIGIDYEQ